MKISFTTVFYNNSLEEIKKLVSNFKGMNASGYDFDTYLVNNSPENTAINDYLLSVDRDDPQIHSIIAARNRGFGAGNNLAISKVNSDYHIIVNPDVKIPNTNEVVRMVTYMQLHNVVLLSPKIYDKNGNIQKLVKRDPSVFDMAIRFLGKNVFLRRQRWFTFDNQYDEIHEASNLSGSFLVFKTKTLKEIGGFDERYFMYMEDADICRSMATMGKAVYYPDAYVIHEWQRENQKSIKGISRMILSMCKYFSKWGLKLK